ncbi:MAG: hypothetical protein GXO21_07955 [Aquificae bacterium]|nr:hypothetical protein [Aquificota bacterium]
MGILNHLEAKELNKRIKEEELKLLDMKVALLKLEEDKKAIELEKERVKAEALQLIAQNKALKNETQRKAALMDMLNNNRWYQDLEKEEKNIESKISKTIYKIKRQQIEIDFLKRELDILLSSS